MEEEGPGASHLPESWKQRGLYICRYLAILFAHHQFLFEMDTFTELNEFPTFLNFLFGLIEP
jgi:hypothetical protein